MPEYKPITLKEIVEEIQKGSRDFTYRTLTGSRNLEVAGLEELNNYLRSLEPAQLKESPVAISYSFFQGLKAHRIYLPHLRGIEARLQEADLRGADLKEANFSGANLERANLYRTDLRGATLHKSNLEGAILGKAKLMGTNLGGAKLGGADLWEANLHKADLRGVKNLSYVSGLTAESFDETIVTEEEKATIEGIIKLKKLFIIKSLDEE